MARKNYIGRTNRNGTVVTRATHNRIASELLLAEQSRRDRRLARWLRANPGCARHQAPRHIRRAA